MVRLVSAWGGAVGNPVGSFGLTGAPLGGATATGAGESGGGGGVGQGVGNGVGCGSGQGF